MKPALSGEPEAPGHGALHWLCGHRERFSAHTRTTLMRTLLVQTPSMVLGSLSAIILAVMASMRVPNSRWAYVWIVCEVILLGVRLAIMRVAKRDIRGMHDRPFYCYVGAAVAWCALLGAGAGACVKDGDAALIALAGINIAGVAAGISTRTAAFPRLAVFQMLLVGTPYAVAAASRATAGLSILAIEIPMLIVAMVSLALAHYSDTVKLVRAERENWFLAYHDALTGLPNRKQAHDGLDRICAGLETDEPAFAVLYLDLDGFKRVNDTWGHPVGDALLVSVAQRLQKEVRASDMVARVGGDEFVILMPGAEPPEVTQIAQRIITAIGTPFVLEVAGSVSIGTTIGIAFAPDDGTTGDVLLARADQALYAAKRAGRGQYRLYAAPGAGFSASAS